MKSKRIERGNQHRSVRQAPKARPEREGPHRIELILVGRELLRGRITDGNAKFLAGRFTERGDRVERIAIVDDDEARIGDALLAALERRPSPNLVVLTGGLGPSPDDRTRAAVAEALGHPLAESPRAREMVEAAYVRLRDNRLTDRAGMTQTREELCRIPVGSTPIPNERGVAPGFICRLPGGAHVLALPGRPEEMRPMLEAVLAEFRELAPTGRRAREEVEAPVPDESLLRPMLDRIADEFPGLWVSSRAVGTGKRDARVLVTLEFRAATQDEADARVGSALRRLLALASGSR